MNLNKIIRFTATAATVAVVAPFIHGVIIGWRKQAIKEEIEIRRLKAERDLFNV